jgi:hypothetical protein
MRTCDAVGACLAVPDTPHYREALAHGDTLGPARRPHIHWVAPSKERQRAAGWRIGAAEACVEIPMVGAGASLNWRWPAASSCTGWPGRREVRTPTSLPVAAPGRLVSARE